MITYHFGFPVEARFHYCRGNQAFSWLDVNLRMGAQFCEWAKKKLRLNSITALSLSQRQWCNGSNTYPVNSLGGIYPVRRRTCNGWDVICWHFKGDRENLRRGRVHLFTQELPADCRLRRWKGCLQQIKGGVETKDTIAKVGLLPFWFDWHRELAVGKKERGMH